MEEKNKFVKNILDNINNDEEYRVVFIGDSNTSNEWIHPNWREIVEYVLKSQLELKTNDWKKPSWNLRFFNSGYDGATTEDIKLMLEKRILSLKPNLCIVMLSRNDMDFSLGQDKHYQNLNEILNELINSGSEVIYSTPHPSLRKLENDNYKKYLLASKKLKENPLMNKVLFIDLFKEFEPLDLNKFYTFISEQNSVAGVKEGEIDPTHLNMIGNAYLAKVFLEKIFEINFDPDKYLSSLLSGDKYPQY